MSFTLEFPDSEVGSVSAHEDKLLVRFSSAAAIKMETKTVGFLRPVEIALHQAIPSGNFHLCFGRLSSGTLAVGHLAVSSVPIPYHSSLPVSLELQFRNGEALSIEAKAITISLKGPPLFSESYAC